MSVVTPLLDMTATGRPTIYTSELADQICERIANGESLRGICGDADMPHAGTVCRWLGRHDDFREQYARARDAQADVLFDEILHIADTPMEGVKTKTVEDEDGIRTETMTADMIEHRRTQIDARKWVLGKMQPKKYGDRLDLNHGVQDSLAELMAAVDGKTRGLPNGG